MTRPIPTWSWRRQGNGVVFGSGQHHRRRRRVLARRRVRLRWLDRRIDHHERNALLAESLPDVTDAVLCNSESQTLAISLAASQAPQLLNRHERLIDNLEHNNGINRTTEVLPTKKELVSRTQSVLGLTRPEIALFESDLLADYSEPCVTEGRALSETAVFLGLRNRDRRWLSAFLACLTPSTG